MLFDPVNFVEKLLFMVMVMTMVMLTVRTGRVIDLSTTRLTMVAAAGLAEYDPPPQITG